MLPALQLTSFPRWLPTYFRALPVPRLLLTPFANIHLRCRTILLGAIDRSPVVVPETLAYEVLTTTDDTMTPETTMISDNNLTLVKYPVL